MEKPFAWYGGKAKLVPTLLTLLPPHQVYVEVFGGSGALLFAKLPSPLEVFNDLDSGVVHFFRTLRDPALAEALQRALSLTPYAREEYYDCLKHWQETDEPVERARRWYCAVMQSMNCSIRATGWSSTRKPGSNPASAWQNSVARLTACTDRLRNVQIDHRDFAAVIAAYDSPVTCFYLDPPYVSETRRKATCYWHEMDMADHERLLSCLQTVQGMVILSGYAHPLYQEALTGWECLTVSLSCSSESRANREGQQTAIRQTTRTECIWLNLACTHAQVSLFDVQSYS